MLVMLFSGCEDRGYGTQDISVVPSVTGSDKVKLVNSIPKNGGALAQRAYINVTFSSYVDENSVSSATVHLQKGSQTIATEFLVLRNFVFIKPLESLDINTSYTLRVRGLKDIFDNDLAQDYTLNFTCKSDFWKRAKAGVSNSMAQSKAGDLYIWGSNAPLPIDTEAEEIKIVTIDMPIPIPHTLGALDFDVGPNSMAMVTSSGGLVEIGLNAYSDRENSGYASVSTGTNHTVVLKDDGTIFSWGSNSEGQLGTSLILKEKSEPTQEYTKDDNWSEVSAGANFTIALKKDGTVWGWGENSFGQVGRKFVTIPLPLELNTSGTTIGKVIQISAGGTHTLALDENRSLWAWGDNTQGALGDGSNVNTYVGTKVEGSQKWQSVSAGFAHTLALDENRSLWGWGNNGSGQLGTGTTLDAPAPQQEINTTRQWEQISAGKDYSLGVTTDGRLWAWGTNTDLRLGLDESVDNTDIPQEVK